MFWSSITKHWPVPPYTSPVPPSNNQCRPLPTHPPLLTQFLQVPTSSALVLTQCHQIRTGIWKNINLHIFSQLDNILIHIRGRVSPGLPVILAYIKCFKWEALTLSGNFPDCPGIFKHVQKLPTFSQNFPDCLGTYQILWKFSRLSGNSEDCMETFQTG